MKTNEKSLIHVGKYHPPKRGTRWLFLRKLSPHHYIWFEADGDNETKTEVEASSIEEALRLAHRTWKSHAFRTLICGFRYTLPERDEHGMNALFHQMATSQNTMNGTYFDESLGHNCFVQGASQEALELLKDLSASNRL